MIQAASGALHNPPSFIKINLIQLQRRTTIEALALEGFFIPNAHIRNTPQPTGSFLLFKIISFLSKKIVGS
jgi:hypothetical protein